MSNQKLRDFFIECDYKQDIKDKASIRDIAIMHDLGMYGDDIEVYLYNFIENDLGVTIEEIETILGYRIMDYFRPEFRPWWYIFKRSKMAKYPRFTIGMLEDAIEEVLKNRENNQ